MSRNMIASGIDWIGDIPSNWRLIRGKFLFRERNERGNSITLQLLSPTQKYGVVPQDLYEELSGMKAVKLETNIDLSTLKSIYIGDYCISLRSFQGGFEYSKYNGVVSPAYHVFYKISDLDDGYYRYLFKERSFIEKMASLTKTFRDGKNISFADFGDSLIPCPPADEQRKISEYLDQKCSEIDLIIADTQRTIEEYKKLKLTIITDAVTKGTSGARDMKKVNLTFADTIPENWGYSPIKHVAIFQPTCDTSSLGEDTEITYTPMDCIKNGYYIPNTAKYGAVAASLTPYEEGDIVMAKVTPCFENGNIAIMENLSAGFGMGSSELFVYRSTRVNKRFLLYWLQNNKFKDAACATMTGTGGLKRVSPYFAKNAMIFLPPEDEQMEIVAFLDEKCAEMDRLIAAKEQLLAELETYKKSVIYEYVTGKKEVPACQ